MPEYEESTTAEFAGWAWLDENGVRGVLNMQTGAFQVPCVVRVDREYLKKDLEKKEN